MYASSAEYKVAIAANARTTRITGTLTLANATNIAITPSMVISGSLYLSEQCVTGESIEIGNVFASELGIGLITSENLEGAHLHLLFGIVTGYTDDEVPEEIWEDIPLGVFNVVDPKRNIVSTSLVALDNMILLDVALGATDTTAETCEGLITKACATAGVTLATTHAIFETYPNKALSLTLPVNSAVKTCRDLIMWACQANSTFARMSRTGMLEIKPLHSASVRSIASTERYSPTVVSDLAIKITGLDMKIGETMYTVGTTNLMMALQGNPLLKTQDATAIDTALDSILADITQAEYTPFDISFIGDPTLQAGDYVTLEDTTKAIDPVGLVTHNTWRYRGRHSLRSVGKPGIVPSYVDQNKKKLTSLTADIAHIGDLMVSGILTVGSNSTFGSGYDPSTKETPTGAQAKADAAYTAAQLFVNGVATGLQSQIDGSITTWFYAYVPTLVNVPANTWTTTALENQHLGDLFYDTATGYCYRFQLVTGTYLWSVITDTDVTLALENASKAQDTADGKRRVFVAQPVTPYDIGDLWAGGSAGDLKKCKTAKTSAGSYSSDDWELASKYTDDTTANQAISDASDAQGAADDAQGDATTALNYTNNLANDTVITPDEKLTLKPKWNEIVVEGFPALTNLVTNGNFVNNATWNNGNSTVSVFNNIYTLIGAGNDPEAYAYQVLGTTVIIGHKYYYKFVARVTNSVCVAILTLAPGVGWANAILTPSINTWYPLSVVSEATSASDVVGFQHYYADAATANGKVMEVQQVQGIDLTAEFCNGIVGTGLEPTAAQFEAMQTSIGVGKNLFDIGSLSTTITSGIYYRHYQIIPATPYTAYILSLTKNYNIVLVRGYTSLPTPATIETFTAQVYTTTTTSVTFPASYPINYIMVILEAGNTTPVSADSWSNVQFELGSTATLYVPHNPSWFDGTYAYGKIPAQALSFGVNDSAYDAKFSTLHSYLINDLDLFTIMGDPKIELVRVTWDLTWNDYYGARTDLLNTIAAKAKTLADTAQDAANSKSATFAQNTVPTSISIGDLWFDTNDGNKCYKSTAIGDNEIAAGEWVLFQDLNKTTTFAQIGIPISTAIGDIWIDTDDSNKMYRATSIGAAVAAVPIMTADNVPSPYVASTSFVQIATQGAYMAFDSNNGLGSCSHSTEGVTTGTFNMDFGTAKVITMYSMMIQRGYSSRAPRTWAFQGSSNNADWTTLDTITDYPTGGWVNDVYSSFVCANTTAYRYYRINVSANEGDAYLTLTGIQFFTDGWTLVRDSGITTAIQAAADAQGAIDDLAPLGLIEIAKLGETVIEGGFVKTTLIDVESIIASGSIIVTGDNISGLTNDEGYTDDTVANAIQVGGRNYILNSANLSVSGLVSHTEYQQLNVGQSYMNIPNGTNVVISFDLEMTVNSANPSLYVYNSNIPGPKNIGGGSPYLVGAVGSTIKGRYSFNTTILDRTSSIGYNTIEFYSQYESTNWYKITNLKVEVGNKATDWTPAPEDVAADIFTAQAAAANAQTTADIKRRVFVDQPSTPYNVGDLWLTSMSDFAGDIKKCSTQRLTGAYTATDWRVALGPTEASKLGTTVLVGGYLLNDLIETGSITAEKIATNAIIVGGRNLLQNTNGFVDTDHWAAGGNHVASVGLDSLNIAASGGGNASNYVLQNLVLGIVNGQEYTISFDVGSYTGGESLHCELWGSVNAFDTTCIAGWTHVSHKLTGSSQTQPLCFWLTAAGSVYITNIKLEIGNRETTWSPAVEDMVSQKNLAISGQTIIDGGNVTTGIIQSIDGKTYFNLNTSEIKQTATVGGKAIAITINGTVGIEMTTDGAKMFGLSADGYAYVNRLYDPDDPAAYVQVGKIDASSSMFTMYRQTGGAYTTFRKRLQILQYGPTATNIDCPVRGTIDTDGAAVFTLSHGDAQLWLWGDTAGGGTTILQCGDAEVRTNSYYGPVMNFTGGSIGVDATGSYKSKDNEKVYLDTIMSGTTDLNNLKGAAFDGYKGFTWSAANAPGYGFLEILYYHGGNFAPRSGAQRVTMQRWTSYDGTQQSVRCYHDDDGTDYWDAWSTYR